MLSALPGTAERSECPFEKKFGAPQIVNDGISCHEIELEDPLKTPALD